MKYTSSYLISTALVCAAIVCLGTLPAPAADSLYICQSGVPYVYPAGGTNIPFNPDQGDLGPLTNAQAVAAVTQAFQVWQDVSTSTVTFLNAGQMPFDVDITNYGPILNPTGVDGLSPIVFDDDGSIFTLLFGAGSGILGFAGPDFGDTVTCELIEGSSFLNGPEFDDLDVAADIMVHEFGHYFNLGHVELNGQLVGFSEGGDTSGPTPDSTTFGTPTFVGTEVIETMYPFYFGSGVGTRTLHADDIASISTLYPEPTFLANTGTISGVILASNGVTRLSGVNVIGRNINDPFIDSVSTFSGAYTDSTSQTDPNVGVFTLNGLTPGEEYAVFVDTVTAAAGRFSNPILQPLPGAEEYWNGANESSDPAVDDPMQLVLITPAAGSPVSGTDIILNGAGPGEIPLGDDDYAELFLPFEYEICGQTFDSIFVNSNGNLTFGSGDTDFSESVSELLSDQPRIAGLWDDLNPSQGGVVSYSETHNTFSVRFENVPEYGSSSGNSFEITLRRASNHIKVDYFDLAAVDGLAGVSCGGAVTSGFEPASDLSSFGPSRINLKNHPAVYEVFGSANPGDLGNSRLRYNGTTDYEDSWAEPNDTLTHARRISLPFDSIPVTRFTEIEPTGGDLDIFRFRAEAGTILIAEIVSGQLDTMIGLADSTGTLVAFDDDGGTGVLSRIAYPVASGGYYYLVVTTYPDINFTGAGASGGRYVLEIETSNRIPLTLGDDASVEVALGFTFPFQGQSWTSVFVNSNGNLTFGSGDTDYSESVSELLSDQPRIAPLWDDLSPNQGGQVSVEYGAGSATISYVDVPEFFASTTNTFLVTLSDDGSVSIEYGGVAALDGLVGVTEGGGAADPGETDLSAGGPYPAGGTTYEQFTGGSDAFDLDLSTLVFAP